MHGPAQASWNHALGRSQGEAEAQSLRERLEALERLLTDANAEVARLSEEAYTDPVAKCEPRICMCACAHEEVQCMQSMVRPPPFCIQASPPSMHARSSSRRRCAALQPRICTCTDA